LLILHIDISLSSNYLKIGVLNVQRCKNIDIKNYNIISPKLTNDELKLPPHIYGQFIDYLIRYKISMYLGNRFYDNRAEQTLSIISDNDNIDNNEIHKNFKIIYESYKNLKTKNEDYLNNIFNVSLCHSLFFKNIDCLNYIDHIKNKNFIYDENNLNLFIDDLCKNKKNILCNPDLTNNELQILADADLIIDNEIIDFKCSENLIGEEINDYIQIFIYACLYFIKNNIKCKKISIINMQKNIVYYIDLINWNNYDNFITPTEKKNETKTQL